MVEAQKKYGERSQGKQTLLFNGGKSPRTCFYSDCVADQLIKGGQGQKYGGIFVYYIFYYIYFYYSLIVYSIC